MPASACITPRPEGTVRPINLAAVLVERPGYELPSRRNNGVLPLILPGGGVAVLIGQCKKGAVIGDGGLLRGVPLSAPGAGEGSGLRIGRKLGDCIFHAEDKTDCEHCSETYAMFHGFSLL